MTLALTGSVGALDGTVTLGTPATASLGATGSVGALEGLLTLSGKPSAALFDENNQWVRSLPLADGLQFSRELSDPGQVTLQLPLTDASDLTAGRFVKIAWRGRWQQAARIQSTGIDFGKDGTAWKQWSNQAGVLDMLRDLVVWPEYGIDRTYSTTRTFGFMSITAAIDGVVTNWFASGDWTRPLNSVRYQDDTGYREFKPVGLSFPNPYWISKNGPYHDEAAGSTQWMRHRFATTVDDIDYQILVTGDRVVELWFDGEQLVSPDQAEAQQWTQLFQIKGTLPAGDHVVATRVENRKHRSSPIAFIFTIQQLQKNGDVVNGAPLFNSRPGWYVSDVLPGFRAGDVLRRCIKENRDQGVNAADLISFDFNVLTDTGGTTWTDDPDQHSFDVGADMLDVFTQLAGKYLDGEMDPRNLRLHAWGRKGSDLHSTVQISRGHQDTGSITDEQIDTTLPRFNSVLFQLSDGTWDTEENSASITANGRAVQAASFGTVASERRARKIADGMLNDQTKQADSFTVYITDSAGPQPGIDFNEGDTISVQDETGAWLPVRVMGWLADASQDGPVKIQLEVERDWSV